MKKTFFYMASAALLVMTLQAAAATPRHPGGAAYHAPSYAVGGYYGPPVGRHVWRGGYWGPGVGVYYGPGFGYRGAWNYGWGPRYGIPVTYPFPYPDGYPLAPLLINTTPITQTYIQQEPTFEAAIQPAPADNYWYYCTHPAGYFPYVQNCSQPWIKVIPQSPTNPQ